MRELVGKSTDMLFELFTTTTPLPEQINTKPKGNLINARRMTECGGGERLQKGSVRARQHENDGKGH